MILRTMPIRHDVADTRVPRIVFVGAHPDDVELGAGATMRAFSDHGNEVVYISATKGERGGDPAARVQESIAACKVLGVRAENVFFGDFADTQLPDSYEVISFLEQWSGRGTSIALIPSMNETHQDHRKLSHCCVTAFRNVPRILAYESPSTTAAFSPNAFVDIGQHLRAKRLALQCHRSQIQQCRMCMEYRSMIQLAAFRGRQAGVKYAEAFEAIKFLVEPSAHMEK